MEDNSGNSATLTEIDELLDDSYFCQKISPRKATSKTVNESRVSIETTPDLLNSAFVQDVDGSEKEDEHIPSAQPQSQTRETASSIIHRVIDQIVEQDHAKIHRYKPLKPTTLSVGTMRKITATKSIGTMPKTPTTTSTGTMPMTPQPKSTESIQQTTTSAADLSTKETLTVTPKFKSIGTMSDVPTIASIGTMTNQPKTTSVATMTPTLVTKSTETASRE